MKSRLAPSFALLSVLLAFGFAAAPALAAPAGGWVATWGASPAPQLRTESEMRAAKLAFRDQTLREIVHLSLGGGRIRVRLSNAYGRQSLALASVHVAVSAGGSRIQADSDRTLKFDGREQVTIPPDACVWSDPAELAAPSGGELAISLYVPGPALAAGTHYGAQQTSYLAEGDRAGAAAFPDSAATASSWSFLAGVDVAAVAPDFALVAFGDSITDGAHSTPGANHRWPDYLAERLRRAGGAGIGVVDAGIGGNRLLHDPAKRIQFGVNALARFDRDVLEVPGVRCVIVLEGINDIGHPGSDAPVSETVSAQDLSFGLRQLVERAHERGLKIFGATLTPFAPTTIPGYFSPEKEATRQALNTWIRTSGAFDGVVDFDRAVRDPAHPDRMLPAYDSGDHLHPNDRGYEAMAESVDLAIFR